MFFPGNTFAFFRFHFQFSTMTFGNNIIAHTQSKSCAFAGGLGGKERLKDFVQHLCRNSVSVVFYLYKNLLPSRFVLTETVGAYSAPVLPFAGAAPSFFFRSVTA